MKIIKTYALSEKTLEKDIDKFIREAKKGCFSYDNKYGREGLKMLKAYFRIIEEELQKQNYSECRICYRKILYLIIPREYDYFNYSDILEKFNAEKVVGNYFECLVKTCKVEELFKEWGDFLKLDEDLNFDSISLALFSGLSYSNLDKFKGLVQKAMIGLSKDYNPYNYVFFLLDYAKHRKDKKEYFRLCDEYDELIDGQEWKKNYAD
jgi:hypothetical protein